MRGTRASPQSWKCKLRLSLQGYNRPDEVGRWHEGINASDRYGFGGKRFEFARVQIT
jgi:hypothetical protein